MIGLRTPRRARRLPRSILLASAMILCATALMHGAARAQQADGKQVYRDANCMGCHKWHGEGGGGYGGAALSLRETSADRDQLVEIIACGRPGTRMPFHLRDAWSQSAPCYGMTKDSLGGPLPPRPAKFLRDYQIEAVADYVAHTLQGRGAPTRAECEAFWGAGARECAAY